MTLGGEGLGHNANFSMNFGPSLSCFAPDSRCRWSKQRCLTMAAPIKFYRRRSTKLACLITWFFVYIYEIQNIQLNRGLPCAGV